MSDILYRWLNEEVRLSKVVDPGTFAKDFSNGYLIGEILHTYRMQDDFNMFLKRYNSVDKVNNFTRLDPTLKLLGVPFDINTARDLMHEKEDAAKRLLYQLYVALEQKNINKTKMDHMQPAVRANLHKEEHEMFTYRLPRVGKRDTDVNFQKMSQQHVDNRSTVTQPIQEKRQINILDKIRIENVEKVCYERQNDLTTEDQRKKASFDPAPLDMRRKKQQHKEKSLKVQTEIAQFERKREKLLTSDYAPPSNSSVQPLAADFPHSKVSGSITKPMLQPNIKHIQEFQQRLKDKTFASEQRERRLDRFLIEQFKAHEAQQEMQGDEQLVKRLTRPTKQEQRLVNQLMIIRKQKDVILENRRFRELQYQQRRQQDLQEALYREAVLAHHTKWVFEEEVKKELEGTQRQQKEHFLSCKDILEQIVDLATKVGEYHLITEKDQIPEKQMKQWKEVLLRGLPLYESKRSDQPVIEFSTSLHPADLEKQEILNKLEYDEYASMVGDWAFFKENGETTLLPAPNNILGHVIHRLKQMVHPPIIESSSLSLPHCTIKACVLGKLCSGKTTCLAKISEALGICVLSADTLIEEALQAKKNGGDTTQIAAAEEEMRKGNTFPEKLLVDILVEAIRKVPDQSGWILDGFPYDINLAHLLEEALGGSVDEEKDVESNKTSLAPNPYLTKTPPPPAPVLDVALLLNIPDECVVRRAYRHLEVAATDKTLYRGQIPHRIFTFRDTWPALQQWFGEKQNILVTIDAYVDEAELYSKVESTLKQVIQEKQTGRSENVSPALASNEDSQGVLESQLESTSLEGHQDSSSQVYVDEPVPLDVAESLCSHWDNLCDSYVNDVKKVLQSLHLNNAAIDYELLNIREQSKHFLGRLDLKYEFVSEWQKSFNSMPDNLRGDEGTKADLHLRFDELCERLWDIINKRKEADEQQRATLMCNGWLEDYIPTLINHHTILMQVELKRFQETLYILRVYYWSMHREVPLTKFSNVFNVPLMEPLGVKDLAEKRCTDFKNVTAYMENQGQAETGKLSNEKLISDYKEAVKTIRELVSVEVQQRETNEEEKLQETEEKKTQNASAKNSKNKKQSKKQKAPAVEPEKTPTEINQDETDVQTSREKIHKEYAAALKHEEMAAMVRIELVKEHGLMMVHSLQRRTQEIFSNMEKWLQARYQAEKESMDQLSEVVCHHIEAGAKLEYELVLYSSDFYLNGDIHFVASMTPPPPCPPSLEKPLQPTPTVIHLESLYHQFHSFAQSGFLSCPEFLNLLEDMVSANMGGNTLPEPWREMNEVQLLEIVSLLMNDYKLAGWQQFLHSAALPWSFPSLTQLLNVPHRYKLADAGDTGYINEDQYLQFFSQLLADPSFCPPRLDYVYTLQNVAADPNPSQGFVRALAVVLGHHLRQSSNGHFVKSMPSLEDDTELSPLEANGHDKGEDDLCATSSFLREQEVSIPALLSVISHKLPKMNDGCSLLQGCLSQEEHTENLIHVYKELGYNSDDCVPFSTLSKHPYIIWLMETSTSSELLNCCQDKEEEEEEEVADSLTLL